LSTLPLSAVDEPTLVALAKAGTDEAFEEIVRRRQAAIRGLLRRLSGNPFTGDDLAQETFLRAWRSLAQVRDPAAFGGWLRQIAVNVWLRRARGWDEPAEPIDENDDAYRIDDSSRALIARLDLAEALTRLREPERLCLVLSYAEGMSHVEIARLTGMPLGTVKSHIARAIKRVRDWLTPDRAREGHS
jgi:RNA polymerase sigma-70 factor (ECF subfamily)